MADLGADDWEIAPLQGDDWEAAPVEAAMPAVQTSGDDWEETSLTEGIGPEPMAAAPNMSIGRPARNPRAGLQSGMVTEDGEAPPNIPFYDQSSQAATAVLGSQPVQNVISQEQQGYDALNKFKKEHIIPVWKATQGVFRGIYMGTGGGAQRQDNNPALAVNLETVLQPLIGKTEGNRGMQETGVMGPGEGDPSAVQAAAYKQAEEFLGPTLGPLYSATAGAFASGYANLPFYMIPVEGPVSGGMLGMVDEDMSPAAGAVMGGVAPAVLKGVGNLAGAAKAKLGSIGVGAGKRLSEFIPIAVLTRDAEPQLAEAIFSMPAGDVADTAIRNAPVEPGMSLSPQEIQSYAQFQIGLNEPKINARIAAKAPLWEAKQAAGEKARFDAMGKTGAATPRALGQLAPTRGNATRPEAINALIVAVDVADGKVVKKGLAFGLQGPHSVTPPANFKGKIVRTPAAEQAMRADPTNPEFSGLMPDPTYTEPVSVTSGPVPEASIDFAAIPEDSGGSVLALEGSGDSASIKLYDAADTKLQVKSATVNHGQLPPKAINELVEHNKSTAMAAAGAQAAEAADMAMSQADIQLGGDGSGGHLPPPPPMDPPPPPPPSPRNVAPEEAIKLKWADSALGRLNTYAQRKLLNPTVRGAQDVADLAFTSHSVDTFERLRDDTMKQLVKASPEISKKTLPGQRVVLANINRFLTGHIDSTNLKTLHPELNKPIHDAIQQHKAQVAANETQLRALGMLLPEQTMKDLKGLDAGEQLEDYATRMYFRHLMKPGEWATLFKKDQEAVSKVTQAIMDDVYTNGKNAILDVADRKAAARRHLDYLLGEPKLIAQAKADPAAVWHDVVSKAGGSLKQRETMKWWKSMAMGEIDNAFIRMAETRARQKQLIVQGEMWKAASINPALSSPGDANAAAEAAGHTVPVPRDPQRFGLMAGRFLHPDAWEALVQAPLAQRNASTLFSKFQNVLKFNQTVGNPGSWVTNFIANSQGIMLSNLAANPFSAPFKVGNGMKLFLQDHAAHRLAPGIKGASLGGDRFTRAMELGVVGSDYSTAEFRESAGVWKTALEKEALGNGGRVNPLEVFPRMLTKGKEHLARLYGTIDPMWKYAAFTSGLEKAGVDLKTNEMDAEKAIKFIGKRYRPGMTLGRIREQAELEIAQRIHYSFPMLDRVGEGVAKAGQAAGLINPYLKVKVELMRNYAQLPRRMASEPGMLANVMAYTAVAGGTMYGLNELRRANGIDQKEVDAAFASTPTSVQRFKPGAMALPWRASNGKLQLIDMTQMFEPLTWTQGSPDTAMASRWLQNTALSPIDGTLLEPEAMGFLSQSGMVDAAYARPNVPEWQEGGAKLLSDTLGRLGPGIFRNTYSTLERGAVGFNPKGGRGPDAPTATPATTAFNMIAGPNRLVESGGPEDKTRAIQAKVREIDQAEAEINALGPKNDGQSMGLITGPLHKADAIAKAKLVLAHKKAELTALQKTLGR